MSFKIYLSDQAERPFIGKFADSVAFEAAKPPIKLYTDKEDIHDEEEELENALKDSAYWEKKKKQRKRFRAKSKFFLNDGEYNETEPGKSQFNFEGQLADTAIASDTAHPDGVYRYVLLQVTNKPVDSFNPTSGVTTVVNAIPVGDWVNFKKPSKSNANVFLDQIDDSYEIKERELSRFNARYKAISKSLSASDDHSSERAPSSFGVEANKRAHSRGGRKQLIGSLLEAVSDTVGDEISFRSGGLKAAADDEEGNGRDRDQERAENIEDDDVDFEMHFDNDEGLEGNDDEQEAALFLEDKAGATTALYADGEDDKGIEADEEVDNGVSVEDDMWYDASDTGDQDQVMSDSSPSAATSAGANGDDNGKSDKDADGKDSTGGPTVIKKYLDDSKVYTNANYSKHVDLAGESARQLKWHMLQKQQQQKAGGSGAGSHGVGGSGAPMKRPREDGVNEDAESKKPRESASDKGTSASVVAASGSLSVLAVTSYIEQVGGKINIKDLAKAFKAQIESAAGGLAEGKALFITIVQQCTVTVTDISGNKILMVRAGSV